MPRSLLQLLLLCLIAALAGCATDGTSPRPRAIVFQTDDLGCLAGTGFDASDLTVACSNIQRGLGSVPAIAMARRPLTIVAEPVVNDSRFTVAAPALAAAIRGQLAAWSPPQWRFPAAADPAGGADYFLVGRLQHLRPLQPVDHVILLYSVQLVDARTSEIMWEGTAELRNRAFHEATDH